MGRVSSMGLEKRAEGCTECHMMRITVRIERNIDNRSRGFRRKNLGTISWNRKWVLSVVMIVHDRVKLEGRPWMDFANPFIFSLNAS